MKVSLFFLIFFLFIQLSESRFRLGKELKKLGKMIERRVSRIGKEIKKGLKIFNRKGKKELKRIIRGRPIRSVNRRLKKITSKIRKRLYYHDPRCIYGRYQISNCP